MARYILFYADGPAARPPDLPPERLQEVIAEYVAWGEKLPPGSMSEGARLSHVWTDPGRIVSGVGERSMVVDGPFAETHEVIGGYAVIEAANYGQAASLCRTHPHLRHGRIIIRELA